MSDSDQLSLCPLPATYYNRWSYPSREGTGSRGHEDGSVRYQCFTDRTERGSCGMRSWRRADGDGRDWFLPEADGDGAVRRGAGRRELRGLAAAVRVRGPGGVDRTGGADRAAARGAADPDRL